MFYNLPTSVVRDIPLLDFCPVYLEQIVGFSFIFVLHRNWSRLSFSCVSLSSTPLFGYLTCLLRHTRPPIFASLLFEHVQDSWTGRSLHLRKVSGIACVGINLIRNVLSYDIAKWSLYRAGISTVQIRKFRHKRNKKTRVADLIHSLALAGGLLAFILVRGNDVQGPTSVHRNGTNIKTATSLDDAFPPSSLQRR